MRKRLFYDKVTFSADTDDITIIQPRYIHDIDITIDVTSSDSAAASFTEILGVLSKAQVKLTGKVVTELSGTDILAYTCLVEGKSPKYLVPGAASELGKIEGLILPLRLRPGEHVLSVRYFYEAQTNVASAKLSFSTLESDEVLEDRHIEMPTFNFTPPSTAAYNTALDVSFTGTIEGFLVYSTTIPTTSSDTCTVKKLRIKVDGDIVFEDIWENLSAQTNYPEDSTLRGVLDNYVYIDFSKAPIEAGRRVELEIYSDDTNAVKIIPILRV